MLKVSLSLFLPFLLPLRLFFALHFGSTQIANLMFGKKRLVLIHSTIEAYALCP